jgi:hypothetical protein
MWFGSHESLNKMSSVLNRLKSKSILKNLPPEVMRNFVTPKVAEFREIPWNSTNAIIQNVES